MKLLLVEDDETIAELVRAGLEEARYSVDVAGDGPSGLARARSGEYSLVILDRMLPGRDGLSICRELRQGRVRTPILMLTARDAIPERIEGLEAGADDYLVKPFDFGELIARVRALLRRDKVHRGRVIQIADLEVDTTRRQVRRGGEEIHLTPREYGLLEALALNEGRPLSREEILRRVWDDPDAFSNIVDVNVTYLRRKIDAGRPVRLIRTVHGVGYVLRATGEES